MKRIITLALGFGTAALPLAAYAGTMAHAPKPKVGKARAEAIAMAAAKGGTVADSEYEKENGKWRWSFDIRQNGRIHEIGVDATTGRIVENSWENPAKEAHEAD